MKRLTPTTIDSFTGKDVRLVYPVRNSSPNGIVIEVDHKITPPVKLLKFIPPSKAEIQRSDGTTETISFEEVWDPNAVKPIMNNLPVFPHK